MKINMRKCWVYNCGLINYQAAWNWQKNLQQERTVDRALNDVLILLEHPPVYTLGTGSSLEFVKFDLDRANYDIYRIDRGVKLPTIVPVKLLGIQF